MIYRVSLREEVSRSRGAFERVRYTDSVRLQLILNIKNRS